MAFKLNSKLSRRGGHQRGGSHGGREGGLQVYSICPKDLLWGDGRCRDEDSKHIKQICNILHFVICNIGDSK